ncbi:MAG: hypothetical protein ACO1RT_01785 [Planctomycetaceae bacterium]
MQFPCPTCSATLSLPDDAAGRKAQCPSCQSVFQVPTALPYSAQASELAAVVHRGRTDSVNCPGCDKRLAFNASTAGQVVICPTCQRRIRMPTAAAFYDATAAVAETSSPSPVAPAWGVPASPVDGPLIRRNADPYSAPMPDPSRRAVGTTDYATPGWMWFGTSVVTLGYDFLWTALMVFSMFADNVDADALIGFIFLFGWAGLSILAHSVMLLGALRMTQRRSLGMARLGAFMGLLPCGMCSVIQIPFAVWAIVVLHNSDAAQDFSD